MFCFFHLKTTNNKQQYHMFWDEQFKTQQVLKHKKQLQQMQHLMEQQLSKSHPGVSLTQHSLRECC